jgi:cellulose synthase/poly-beta-1,6-N-acetylglucosamine synthase-like glycosyltransferase
VQAKRDWIYTRGRQDRRAQARASGDLLAVSLVIPAHNEERPLKEELASLRQLDNLRERLEVVFVSDGSTGGANATLESAAGDGVDALISGARKGKPSALNEGVRRARHDILVFCDAVTLLAADALRRLVRHFAGPAVGVARGTIAFRDTPSLVNPKVYWRLESALMLS